MLKPIRTKQLWQEQLVKEAASICTQKSPQLPDVNSLIKRIESALSDTDEITLRFWLARVKSVKRRLDKQK